MAFKTSVILYYKLLYCFVFEIQNNIQNEVIKNTLFSRMKKYNKEENKYISDVQSWFQIKIDFHQWISNHPSCSNKNRFKKHSIQFCGQEFPHYTYRRSSSMADTCPDNVKRL